MKLIVFGATGRVGEQIVKMGLENGHKITAVTRNPSKIVMKNENLVISTSDVMNYQSVEDAISDHDAVICTLGDGTKGKVRFPGTKNIVMAMEKLSIKRFICQSTIGAGDSRVNLNLTWRFIFGSILKKALLDHNEQEAYVMDSKLNYTIVRPGGFTDGPLTKDIRHGFTSTDKTIKLKISCSDIAYFILNQIDKEKYSRKNVSISY